jgi:exopolysaccharide biosynthesis operon protein EpsL
VGFLVKRLNLAWLCLLAPSVAQALPDDTFRPFVDFTTTYDNNVFRASDANAQSDFVNTLRGGVDVDWQPGRQQVIARAALGYTRYVTEDTKVRDHDLQLRWNWQLGNHWQGDLGVSDTQQANSYENINALVTDNTLAEKRLFGEARYRFHPRWQVRAGAEQRQVSYSAIQLSDRDRDIDRATLGVDYLTPKGGKIGFDYQRGEADYLNTSGGFDNDYSQDSLNLRMTWVVDGKSRVLARLGQVTRKQVQVPSRDFDGFVADVEGIWQASGKVRLSAKIYRDIDGTSDAAASYSLDTGLDLAADWQLSSKLALQGRANYETRDFQGDPTNGTSGLPIRQDELASASLSLSYQPFLSTNVLLSYQTGSRGTNRATVTDYSFQSLTARLLVQF